MSPETHTALVAIAEARRALDRAAVALCGDTGGTAAMIWPPRAEDIDLADPIWLTPQQAAAIAKTGVDTIYDWLTGPKGADIAIKVLGRWHVHRGRLLLPR